jgi:molybdate transport repressor ModE-like protein
MNIPDLAPHALASLVSVAQFGSVSAAARARGLSQPSISRQIQDLERTLGVPLLERTTHGARLTPAGEALVAGAREVLDHLARLPGLVQARQGEVAGMVRLGTVDSIGIHVLPPILARFLQAHPRIEVQVTCASSPQLMNLLLDNQLEVALGTTEHPRLASERLYQNPLVVAFPPSLPEDQVPDTLAGLALRRVVTFAEGLTIRSLLDQAFAKAGLEFQPVMGLANVEVIKAMVRSGLGLGIIPDGSLLGGELSTKPIRDLGVARTIRLLTRLGEPSLATATLCDELRKLRQP